MNVLEQHSGCVWIALFMAAGIHVVLRLLLMIRRSLGKSVPRNMAEYIFDLEETATTAVRADLYAAQARATLAEKIGKVPADFDPTLLYACQVSAGIHQAATVEAERQGIIRSGTYERLYGRSIDGEGDGDGPLNPGGDGERAPVVLDEVRRRRERERSLARRETRETRGDAREFSADPFAEPLRETRERPAVPCSWSNGKLVPTARGGNKRASA